MVSTSVREGAPLVPAQVGSVEISGHLAGAHASPVHELQARLERFEAGSEVCDSDSLPPRGWAIIAWPVGLSLVLWVVIIEVIFAVLPKFVA